MSQETKKQQILSLFSSGIHDIAELALLTQSRPSYVASVLQAQGRLTGYFDLYTNSSHPMNIYSKFFSGRLGFKDEPTAQESVRFIDRLYRQFEKVKDRAGQHHALGVALTLCNRARWSGKLREAAVFREWIVSHLVDPVQAVGDAPPLCA